jgi:uncharacterized protein YwgA
MKALTHISKDPILIFYLVKRLKERYPDNPVNKTVVQKMFFLLTRLENRDLKYSLYHFGPYSRMVALELHSASDSGLLNIEWDDKSGHVIKLNGSNGNGPNPSLNENEKQEINEIVEKFGKFDVSQLIMITSALFSKDRFKTPDGKLPNIIAKMKGVAVKIAKDILKQAEVI